MWKVCVWKFCFTGMRSLSYTGLRKTFCYTGFRTFCYTYVNRTFCYTGERKIWYSDVRRTFCYMDVRAFCYTGVKKNFCSTCLRTVLLYGWENSLFLHPSAGRLGGSWPTQFLIHLLHISFHFFLFFFLFTAHDGLFFAWTGFLLAFLILVCSLFFFTRPTCFRS